MSVKSIADSWAPPVLRDFFQKSTIYDFFPDRLFGGDDEKFKKYVKDAKIYGEYGMGKSTKWVSENLNCEIYAVDTSISWVEKVRKETEKRKNINLYWVDVGEIGNWGMPKTFNKRENFKKYTDFIWRQNKKPDFVLVDGRFRVACFLTSLLEASPGTIIIFDDYRKRKHYHVVEEILKPIDFCGRQAIFKVPDEFERNATSDLLGKFEFIAA